MFFYFVVVVYHVIVAILSVTWVVEDILAYGNMLRSTHDREFPYCNYADRLTLIWGINVI